MKIPSALVVLSLFAVGCDLSKLKTEETEAEEEGEAAAGERWWEDGYEAPAEDGPTNADGGAGGANDTGSDGDDAGTSREDSFEITVDVESGEGTFGVDFTDCRLSGEIVDGTEATPCADCSLAMSMKIGSINIEQAAGCSDFMDSGGDTMTYGHGNEMLFEFEGVSMHTLFEQVDGEWSQVEDGYSIVMDTSWIIVIDLVE